MAIAPILCPRCAPKGDSGAQAGAASGSGRMKRDLNDVWLRRVKPPATGRLEIRDEEVAGLVLRITASGARTWSIRTRTKDGKQTRPKLGSYPSMGIAAARKAAKLAIAGIMNGADPVEERRAARDARRTRLAEATVSERLAEWQVTRETSVERPWSDRYATEVARLCRHDVQPRLGKRALADTTRADWTSLVAAKRKDAPAMAAALYRVVSSFLGHAEAEGWIAAPLLPRKGAAKLAPSPAARARVLTDSELTEVWHVAGAQSPKARAFIRLLILTAAREMEVADVATGEIDQASGRWRIPGTRTKNGQGYTIPLSPLAMAEIEAVWPKHGERAGPDWRLLGAIAGNGFRGFSKLKARIDAVIVSARAEAQGAKEQPLAPWRWHDLRRTARTGMTRLGIVRDHAEAAINHVSGRSTLERTYDRHDYAAEIAAALSRWQAHVAALVSAQPVAEVVALADRRRTMA